uniref:Uncharacterized protein n=1 Tax=Rhizophora mucronata TaxID=61149 RepID=A0A2P2IRS4_RHIMU
MSVSLGTSSLTPSNKNLSPSIEDILHRAKYSKSVFWSIRSLSAQEILARNVTA